MNICGEELEVVVVRKRIKNIYFRINEDKQIYVTCPKYVSSFEINRLLKNNVSSLEKMYKSIDTRSKEQEKVLYLGQELDFIYYKKVMIDGNNAFGPSIEKVNEYLEKHSLEVFQKRMDLYTPTFFNLPKFRLRVRKMKTRWGVCNKSSMTVTLNTQLIHKDVKLIDYVICHELSHFEHMDHSIAFWDCVERHYPDYKIARKELKK